VSLNPVHGEVYSIQHCQWLLTGREFFPGPLVSSMNKTDCHNIAEILLKVALNTINPQSKHWFVCSSFMLNVSQSHRILNYFKLKSLVLLTFNTTWFYCVWHLLKTCYEYNWNTAYLMFNNNQLSYWFSLATPISSTNKTGHHCITEILLKVALNTINSKLN
jgi:hypothetical protein